MNSGTALFRFKRAYITRLQAVLQNVKYQTPSLASDVLGEDGSGKTAFWADDATIDYGEIVFQSAKIHPYDELITVTLILQILGRDTDSDQEAIDRDLDSMLAEAIRLLSVDPTVGADSTPPIDQYGGAPLHARYHPGNLGEAKRAAHIELDIQVGSRVTLEST